MTGKWFVLLQKTLDVRGPFDTERQARTEAQKVVNESALECYVLECKTTFKRTFVTDEQTTLARA